MTYIVTVRYEGKTVQSEPLTATETMDAMRRVRLDYPTSVVLVKRNKEAVQL